MTSKTNTVDLMIVSSCGGHLTEVRHLSRAYEKYKLVYVLNSVVAVYPDMVGQTEFVTHAERDWRVARNFWEAILLCRKYRPKAMLSTGAGPAVPFFIVAKYLFGAKVVFVESITRVATPSLTAKLLYPIADEFVVQWRGLLTHFPRAKVASMLS
jgi:beta-1,4-N-acetylglucosaminyltransferase